MKAFASVIGVVVAGVWTTALIYLGIYSYNNPDPRECWVVRDLHSAWPNKIDAVARADAMDIDVTSGYPMEMHQVFITWFLWGFWSKIILAISLLFTGATYFCNDQCGKILLFLFGGLYSAQGIVWLGVGAVWRYSKAGIVASGDELARRAGTSDVLWEQQVEAARITNGYQIQSGRFMYYYLFLMSIVIMIGILSFVVGCLWLCCCNPFIEEKAGITIGSN